jgi:hypothetical protein
MSTGIPAFGEGRRRGVESVVPLFIEGDSLEAIVTSLDIGT